MIAKQKIHKGNNFMGAFDYNDKKMRHANPTKRAELLAHNFLSYQRDLIQKEVAMLRSLRPKLSRDAYHVSLNFAKSDNLTNTELIEISREYLKGMGFNDNLYAVWKHKDADHLHVHILASRIRYDGSVVSDSNNYKRSEALCRKLELKYNLTQVESSKNALEKALGKDELEMIERTGKLSNRILMQEKVKKALLNAKSTAEFIARCEKQGVYLLFNQSKTTGRVSGITYVMDGFIAKGQKLGNMFKWNSINQIIKYEQGTENKTVSAANDRTRARFSAILNEANTGNSHATIATGRAAAMDDRQNERDAGHAPETGFQPHIGEADQNREELSANESLSDDLFFRDSNSIWERGHSASRVLSGNQVGGGGDDDGRRKKRRKRR